MLMLKTNPPTSTLATVGSLNTSFPDIEFTMLINIYFGLRDIGQQQGHQLRH